MPTGPFLPLNIDKKVTLLENFHHEYVVVTLQAVDSSGEDTNHLHSIVVKIGRNGANFEGLLQTLDGTSMEVLWPKLEAKYAPWTYTSSESAYRKINSIYRNLSRYAARVEPVVAPRPIRPQARAGDRVASQSRTQGSQSHAQTAAAGRAEPRKRKNDSPSTLDPSQKCRKCKSAGSAKVQEVQKYKCGSRELWLCSNPCRPLAWEEGQPDS